MSLRPRRVGWRRRLWRILTRGAFALVALNALGAALLALGGGDPATLEHPQVRFGGGAWQ